MGKIHILDTEVSNKIAAGEVVERPASVIKELVENSIDASASLITVEIKKGGSTYMRVSDNGTGMSADDAKICFLRHATSKVETSDDLDAIYTLGFRGEALSSIGAVSEVELYTKRVEDETGVCVTCRGGEILSSDEAGIPEGTSITVENLFFNTPARRKFLKKDATETGYITDIMTRFVFAHPEISFKLIVDDKEKLFSPGDSSLKNAVYTAYGKDYANGTIPVEYENSGIKLTGLIGKGTLARPKRNYQSFFVNRRYINSRTIIAALENAYKNQIMIGKFPMAVLNIEIEPSQIDINVHPTKLEVKFSDEKAIYDTVYYGVKSALYAIPNVPKIERNEAKEEKPFKTEEFKRDESKEQLTLSDMADALPKNMMRRPETPSYNPRENHFLKKSENIKDNRDTKIAAKKPQPIPEIKKRDSFDEIPVWQSASLATPPKKQEPIFPVKDIKETAPVEEYNESNETVFTDEYFEIVGQVFNSFIIAEKGDEMMFIDQHAAHERLKYEELLSEIKERPILSQMLIEPVIVNLAPGEMSAYRDNKQLFDKMGFEAEEFGDDSVIVRCAPGEVEMGEVEPLLLELIAQSEELKKELITDKYQRLLYTIACKSAVKANMKMSTMEMEALVRNVLRLKNINTCPHGRPIIITMSKKEIEKEFKRIV
ncbi:MAG: DNA mismatch repair endonuclease MutL [Oscillospiraceae bacterium]|nr:DNA mismatch repair endonuclease MutL [Oscillospiraceae bacterium]